MALNTNLVSYWKLDESSGNASDSVGSNTLTNNNTVTYSAGKINNGADFVAASSQSLSCTFGTDPDTYNSGMTISCWTYVTSNQNGVPFVWFDESGSWGGIYVQMQNGKYEIRFGSGSTSYVLDSGFTTITNQWVHLAMTHNTTYNKVYVNGVEVASQAAQTLANTSTNFRIGRDNASNYLNGKVDEVGIWSSALSADEVSQLANSGRGNAYPFTATPSLYGGVAYYKLDESSGNASDSVGSNTLTNTSTTYAAGKINNGAVFDGSTSKLIKTSASGVSRTGTDEISVSVWVNPSRTSGQYQQLVCNRDATLNWALYMHTTGGEVSFHGSAQNKGTYVPTTSVWTHIVATVDSSSNLKIYANGTLIDTITSFAYGSTTSAIGVGQISNGGEALLGSLDEAGIWNRALTADEITTLYNGGSGNQYPFLITPTISVSDSLTTTESITRSLALTGVSVSESITITESVSRLLSSNISTSETITLTENITDSMSSRISVSEAMTVTDAPTVGAPAVSFSPSMIELMSITEGVTVNVGLLGNISVSDSITTTESKTVQTIMGMSISETVTVSEDVTARMNMNTNVFDLVVMTENYSGTGVLNLQTFESVNITESITPESFRFSPDIQGKIVGTLIKSV